MITAVDTNILVDVLEPDPVFGPSSKELLKLCLRQGRVVACDVVWSETATAYGHAQRQLITALNRMGIEYAAIHLEAALQAAKSWYLYRRQGGTRDRIAADFLIGGHALIQCHRLLTRDSGFYRNYFDTLEIVVE
jgi:predicted nucleic acid-binding protein